MPKWTLVPWSRFHRLLPPPPATPRPTNMPVPQKYIVGRSLPPWVPALLPCAQENTGLAKKPIIFFFCKMIGLSFIFTNY